MSLKQNEMLLISSCRLFYSATPRSRTPQSCQINLPTARQLESRCGTADPTRRRIVRQLTSFRPYGLFRVKEFDPLLIPSARPASRSASGTKVRKKADLNSFTNDWERFLYTEPCDPQTTLISPHLKPLKPTTKKRGLCPLVEKQRETAGSYRRRISPKPPKALKRPKDFDKPTHSESPKPPIKTDDLLRTHRLHGNPLVY